MRLINAFELKQRILEERDKIPLTLPGAEYEFGIEKPNHYGNAMRGGIRKALRCMEQCYNYTLAEGINLTQRWIPVTERLPEDDLPKGSKVKQIKVLTALKSDKGVRTVRSQMRYRCTWYSNYEPWTWKYSGSEITHWMPLPEPPKEV